MKLSIVDIKNQKTGTITVSDVIFAAPPNPNLISQAIHVFLSNQRRSPAKTKTRSQIIGSRRKLWAQKGTGRARHGDRFAPQFVGGGIAHGPTGNQNFHKKINQKMRLLALFVSLSDKIRQKTLTVLSEFPANLTKTQKAAEIIRHLAVGQPLLIVLHQPDIKLTRAIRNLPNTKFLLSHQINTYEILSAKHLLATRNAIQNIEKHFLKTHNPPLENTLKSKTGKTANLPKTGSSK